MIVDVEHLADPGFAVLACGAENDVEVLGVKVNIGEGGTDMVEDTTVVPGELVEAEEADAGE